MKLKKAIEILKDINIYIEKGGLPHWTAHYIFNPEEKEALRTVIEAAEWLNKYEKELRKEGWLLPFLDTEEGGK